MIFSRQMITLNIIYIYMFWSKAMWGYAYATSCSLITPPQFWLTRGILFDCTYAELTLTGFYTPPQGQLTRSNLLKQNAIIVLSCFINCLNSTVKQAGAQASFFVWCGNQTAVACNMLFEAEDTPNAWEHCQRNASAADMNIRINPEAKITSLHPWNVDYLLLTKGRASLKKLAYKH